MEHHEGYDPDAEDRFWFVLDLAIARANAAPLAGRIRVRSCRCCRGACSSRRTASRSSWWREIRRLAGDPRGVPGVGVGERGALAVEGRRRRVGRRTRLDDPAPIAKALARRSTPPSPAPSAARWPRWSTTSAPCSPPLGIGKVQGGPRIFRGAVAPVGSPSRGSDARAHRVPARRNTLHGSRSRSEALPLLPTAAVLSLQRSAGNQAVTSKLAREPAPQAAHGAGLQARRHARRLRLLRRAAVRGRVGPRRDLRAEGRHADQPPAGLPRGHRQRRRGGRQRPLRPGRRRRQGRLRDARGGRRADHRAAAAAVRRRADRDERARGATGRRRRRERRRARERDKPTPASSATDKIMGSIASAEGGFASVEGNDAGVLTWGQGQWTVTAGELQKVLAFIKDRRRDLFDKYWGSGDLDVDGKDFVHDGKKWGPRQEVDDAALPAQRGDDHGVGQPLRSGRDGPADPAAAARVPARRGPRDARQERSAGARRSPCSTRAGRPTSTRWTRTCRRARGRTSRPP